GKSVYALLSPRGHEAFFRAADDHLSARDAYRFTVPIFGEGVAYAVSPELMDEQLRLLHPALRDEAMQNYAGIMANEVERFADRRRASVASNDFLSVLIGARYKDGAALSDAVITGLLLTLLFAGQHTSAVLATWLGVLVLQHPGEVAALRREADAVIGDGPL